MRKDGFVLLICFLTISLISCSTKNEEAEPIRVSGITRILMHEPGYFTFLVEHNNSKKVGQLRVVTYKDNTTILEDLQENQSISIEYSCGSFPGEFYQCKPIPLNFSNWSVRAIKLIIHLHSVKEVGGAGWNHGKFGSGNTTVVQ